MTVKQEVLSGCRPIAHHHRRLNDSDFLDRCDDHCVFGRPLHGIRNAVQRLDIGNANALCRLLERGGDRWSLAYHRQLIISPCKRSASGCGRVSSFSALSSETKFSSATSALRASVTNTSRPFVISAF